MNANDALFIERLEAAMRAAAPAAEAHDRATASTRNLKQRIATLRRDLLDPLVSAKAAAYKRKEIAKYESWIAER